MPLGPKFMHSKFKLGKWRTLNQPDTAPTSESEQPSRLDPDPLNAHAGDEIQLLSALETLENCDLTNTPTDTLADLTQFIYHKASVESNMAVLAEKIPLILPLLDYLDGEDEQMSTQVRYYAAAICESLSCDKNCKERLILDGAVPTLIKQHRAELDEATIKCLDSCLRELSSSDRFSYIFSQLDWQDSRSADKAQKPSKNPTKRPQKKSAPPDLSEQPSKHKSDEEDISLPSETVATIKTNGSRTSDKKSKTIGPEKRSNKKTHSPETRMDTDGDRVVRSHDRIIRSSHDRFHESKRKMRQPGFPANESNTSNSFISSESNKSNSFSSEEYNNSLNALSRSSSRSRKKYRPKRQQSPSSPQPPTTVSVVCLWGNDNRVITVRSNITLAEIMTAIQNEYHQTPSLLKYNSQYWDQMITITKEEDLANCLMQDKKYLIVCSQPSQDSTSSLTHLSGQATGSFVGEFYKNSWAIPYEDLKFEKETILGKGFFGEVRLASYRRQPVAAKILYKKDFRNTTESERFIREVDVLSKLRHPKVILFIGASINLASNDMIIVTEFMDRGSLHAYLRKKRGLSERFMLGVSADVSLAMNYLHGENCFHRDLNSKNILLDRAMNAKLADFGLSKFLSDDPLSESMGAVAWMAPEVLLNPQSFTAYSDVYSFSIVLWEMLTGKGPIAADGQPETPIQFARKIMDKGYRPPLPHEEGKEHWIQLITQCWQTEPKSRPKFSDILDTLQSFDPALNVKISDSRQPVTVSVEDEGTIGGYDKSIASLEPRG